MIGDDIAVGGEILVRSLHIKNNVYLCSPEVRRGIRAVGDKREPGESPGQSRCGNFRSGTAIMPLEGDIALPGRRQRAGISPKTCLTTY